MSADIADREILDAVAAVEDELFELLVRLVESPATFDRFEPGTRTISLLETSAA